MHNWRRYCTGFRYRGIPLIYFLCTDNATDEDQAQQGATLQKREYKKNPAVIRDEDGSVKVNEISLV